MTLKKANAEIIRSNLKTNVVTKRKQDGNYFYAKEKSEILESNPKVSSNNSVTLIYFSKGLRESSELHALQLAIVAIDRNNQKADQRS